MPSSPRMTLPTQRVLSVLLAAPAEEKYGLEICAESELSSGTIHPILARLEGVGWLESRWEDIDPRLEGRPRRRYYRLTSDGIELARAALNGVETRNTRWSLRPGFADGAL